MVKKCKAVNVERFDKDDILVKLKKKNDPLTPEIIKQ